MDTFRGATAAELTYGHNPATLAEKFPGELSQPFDVTEGAQNPELLAAAGNVPTHLASGGLTNLAESDPALQVRGALDGTSVGGKAQSSDQNSHQDHYNWMLHCMHYAAHLCWPVGTSAKLMALNILP